MPRWLREMASSGWPYPPFVSQTLDDDSQPPSELAARLAVELVEALRLDEFDQVRETLNRMALPPQHFARVRGPGGGGIAPRSPGVALSSR